MNSLAKSSSRLDQQH